MKFTSLSNQKLYLNVSQNQTYTSSKIKKLIQRWIDDDLNEDTFKKLISRHFENLIEITKYEIINNRKHSNQCRYATEHSCKCWCKGEYHGKMITQEITQ